eukprot:jgi/Tetstr1/447844/TSEL_003761.t1
MFGKTAIGLLREVDGVPAENLPPYNDEALQQAREEVNEHNQLMTKIFNDVQMGREQQEGSSQQDDWADLPEEACAVLIHHSAILRNKRVLMAYMQKRLDSIKEMWWRSRTLPEEFKSQLGPLELEFFDKYDQLLNKYSGRREGINLMLTVDMEPPKGPSVQVRCVQEHGDVMFSIGKVNLSRNTVHLLPREEAEPFISNGILKYID